MPTSLPRPDRVMESPLSAQVGTRKQTQRETSALINLHPVGDSLRLRVVCGVTHRQKDRPTQRAKTDWPGLPLPGHQDLFSVTWLRNAASSRVPAGFRPGS